MSSEKMLERLKDKKKFHLDKAAKLQIRIDRLEGKGVKYIGVGRTDNFPVSNHKALEIITDKTETS